MESVVVTKITAMKPDQQKMAAWETYCVQINYPKSCHMRGYADKLLTNKAGMTWTLTFGEINLCLVLRKKPLGVCGIFRFIDKTI